MNNTTLLVSLAAFVLLILFLVLMVVRLISSVEQYTSYWNSRAQEPKEENSIVYVALGDSAAQGIGASAAENGYVGGIASRLEKLHSRPVQMINLSRSGDKIVDVIENQLPQLNNLNPDVITLDIGGNDIKEFNKAKFEKDADLLFARLPKNTIVSDIPYFGGRSRFLDKESDSKVRIANEIFRLAAHKHNITLLPLYEETKRRNTFFWTYAIDYFHPNNLGYQSWTDVFWSKVSTMKF